MSRPRCPQCGTGYLLPALEQGTERVQGCLCGYTEPIPVGVSAEPAGDTASASAPAASDQAESAIVTEAFKDLLRLGFIAKRVGQHIVRGSGSDPGVPDMLVTHRKWPSYTWLGLEFKTLTGSLTTEQADLAADKRIRVVRCAAEAIEAAIEVHKHHVGEFSA